MGKLLDWYVYRGMCAITHSMRVITHIMLGGTHEEGDQEIVPSRSCILCSARFVALGIMEGA
jgi:hypothetical protein